MLSEVIIVTNCLFDWQTTDDLLFYGVVAGVTVVTFLVVVLLFMCGFGTF